jgi:hypothetical protein
MTPAELVRLEHVAELRWLQREIQRIAARIALLEEILRGVGE